MSEDIKIINSPAVYVIGRQAVDAGELGRFLADHGVPGWTTDTDVPGQVMSEVGGRV